MSPEEFWRIDLLAHSLLADVPLHDVWAIELYMVVEHFKNQDEAVGKVAPRL